MSTLRNLTALLLLSASAAAAAERVIDLGQVEVEGELRRPQVKWVDSSKRMKDLLPRIHSERFAAIEKKLLKPQSAAQVSAWLQARIQKLKSESSKKGPTP